MKERIDNYRPTDFGSANEELAPVEAAEDAAAPSATESAETPSVFSRGEARYAKIGENLKSMKEGMADAVRQTGENVKGLARDSVVAVLSADEIASRSATGAMDAATPAALGFLNSWNRFSQGAESASDRVLDTLLDAPQNLQAFGEQLKAQAGAFAAEKANDVKTVAEFSGTFVQEKAGAIREGIGSRIRGMRAWGERALALANAKRVEAMGAFRSKMEAARVSQLQRERDAAMQDREALDARIARLNGMLSLRDEVANVPALAMAA